MKTKKEQLRKQWEESCDGYLRELLNMWGLDAFYGYWIGGDVGEIYDYGGMFTIVMEDIIYCVENDVGEGQYTEWQEYICDAGEFGFDTPDFKSWMKGCPRVSEETFAHLRSLKKDLGDAIDCEKERIKDVCHE